VRNPAIPHKATLGLVSTTLLIAQAQIGALAQERSPLDDSSMVAKGSILREPETALHAIRRREINCSRDAERCSRRSGRFTPRTSHLTRDGDRQLDNRPVLWSHAHRPVSRWRSSLSGDAVRILHEGHASGIATHLSLTEDSSASSARRSPARPAVSLQQSLAHPRWRTLYFSEGEYRPDATNPTNGTAALIGWRAGALRDVPHGHSTRSGEVRVGSLPGRPDPDQNWYAHP